MSEGHKLESLDQIGGWAQDHVADTFELDFVWSKPELPHTNPVPLPEFIANIFGPDKHFAFGLSKYMLMELIAAGLMLLIFIPLARRVAAQTKGPKGRFTNCFEAILVYLRDGVAKPAIGHDTDRFMPYLWSVFFFILFCNLLGLVPFGGTATSSIETTAGLAICTFVAVHGSGVKDMGFVPYLKSLVPHVPMFMWPLMFIVEIIGHFAKAFALCVRLFANMFGGHMATTVLLGFIVLLANTDSNWIYIVAPGSIFGVVLLTLFDLFVALLQSYIFTMLSAVFIGMAVHPHH